MPKEIRIDKILDVKGLICPGPTVMTMNTLKDMDRGKILQVITDDNSTRLSIPSLCERAGYNLLELREEEGVLYYLIRK